MQRRTLLATVSHRSRMPSVIRDHSAAMGSVLPAAINVEHHRADQAASKQIECSMLHLWAEGGQARKGGDFFPEENPADTAALVDQFLRR